MKTQYKMNGIARVVLFNSILVIAVIQQVSAQHSRYFRPTHATYLGGSLAMAFPQYELKSSIGAIDGQKVAYTGATLGGMMGNAIGKVKADFGLFYSNASSAYEMQLTQCSVSGNLYLLRLKRGAPYHTLEPYTKLGVASQLTKFYGNYLPGHEGAAPTNYSSDNQPLLNTSTFNQGQVGIGVEYQLENYNNRFIQLFAEVGYSFLVTAKATNTAFAKTSVVNQTSFSFGISVGIIK